MSERFSNRAQSTLDTTINDAVTSLDVASGEGALFPDSGDFRILIGTEILLCTARSSDTLTVERGAEGTTAAAHSAGVAVTHIVTAGGLEAYRADSSYTLGEVFTTGEGLLISSGWLENATNGNECRMRLFCSGDMGLTWNLLYPDYVYKDSADSNVYLAPDNGQVRDCSLFRYKGKYFTAYTNDYGGTDPQFSIASSTDLLNWSALADYTVPAGAGPSGTDPLRVRAPEFFLDDDGTVCLLFSFSSNGSEVNDQLYIITATDDTLSSWSTPPTIITGTSMGSFLIDPMMVKVDGTYYLFFKDATTNRVVVFSSSSRASGYTALNSGVTPNGDNYEAPTLIRLDEGNWRLFVDKRTDQGIHYLDSDDLFATWTTPVEVDSPIRWQHGTVLRLMDLATWRHVVSTFITGARPRSSLTTDTGAVSIPDNAWTSVTMAAVAIDDLGAWQSGSPTILTAPSPGLYSISCSGDWDVNTTGQRLIRVFLNGTTNLAILTQTPTTPAPGPSMCVSVTTYLREGDEVSMQAYQNSGGALNIANCHLYMVRLGGY